ncbi:myosin-11 [Culicoides brevitarsis]|uniref:myosin-11 n=1 Tax=Culicoides brevitarsis TaxID=469753 RepID=UPI00307B2D4E
MDSKQQDQDLVDAMNNLQMSGSGGTLDKSLPGSYREGSDSGVEASGPSLMRELSNNSNDYASSGIGHATDNETGNTTTTTTSCTSSMISCSSDFPTEDTVVNKIECASEGGSESSILLDLDKKPVNANGTLTRRRLNFKEENRRHTITSGPNLLTLARARSRDKSSAAAQVETAKKQETPSRMSTLTRTTSMNRACSAVRTPGTPTTEDGRWPSTIGRTNSRASSVAPVSMSSSAGMSTLPRRRRVDGEERSSISRSSSISRDPMSISMTGRIPQKAPSFRAGKSSRTKIYHETGMQTAITGEDLERAVAKGTKLDVDIEKNAVETKTKETQADIRDREMEKLEAKLRDVQRENEIKTLRIQELEQQVAKDTEIRQLLDKQNQEHSSKLLAIMEPYQTSNSSQSGDETMSYGDILVVLEMQLKSNEKIIRKQQEEVKRLQNTCCALHQDLEKSFAVQQNLVKQKRELEEESTELHEFLQAEKLAFVDALKESENEVSSIRDELTRKTTELEKQQEEVRHLVRVNEQRRQELIGMQAKLCGLENRSKDLLCQQGTAVSDASCALADLSARLENLVESLLKSYEISEQELGEFAGNDVQMNTESPCVSPTQQRNQSFLTAVVNAIKSAATSARQSVQSKHTNGNDDKSDSTEMLDSETEPCLMMENVLEDVHVPDSHSQNLVSTSQIMLSHIEMPPDMYRQDDSLNNLSEAIANRQQLELNELANSIRPAIDDLSPVSNESLLDQPSISEFCTAHALVDQVLEIDCLVTKLLKVLRIVQMNSDCWIQELLVEKEKYEKTEKSTRMEELEEENATIKKELKEVSSQLLQKNTDLVNSKFELQRHRLEIDKLNQDICNLSTLCSSQKSGKTDAKAEDTTHPTDLPDWKKAILEAKRQYEAIDHALEILNSVQSVVEQCPALKSLQQNLEATNFEAATSLPLLNAVLVASVNNGNYCNDTNGNANGGNVTPENGNSVTKLQLSPVHDQAIDSTA